MSYASVELTVNIVFSLCSLYSSEMPKLTFNWYHKSNNEYKKIWSYELFHRLPLHFFFIILFIHLPCAVECHPIHIFSLIWRKKNLKYIHFFIVFMSLFLFDRILGLRTVSYCLHALSIVVYISQKSM